MFFDFAQPISLPIYWLNHPAYIKRYNSKEMPEQIVSYMPLDKERKEPTQAQFLGIPHAVELSFRLSGSTNWWAFPIEPVVSVSGSNNIIKRNVLKVNVNDIDRRGSVKELWSQNDYDITIAGLFIADKNGMLPEKDIAQLRLFCEAKEAIEVKSNFFSLFNITKITIESYDFPFTKGLENQMFTLKCVSDNFDEKNLLIAK